MQVFSAANYCGTARNGAAVALMAENASREIVATFKTIPAWLMYRAVFQALAISALTSYAKQVARDLYCANFFIPKLLRETLPARHAAHAPAVLRQRTAATSGLISTS